MNKEKGQGTLNVRSASPFLKERLGHKSNVPITTQIKELTKETAVALEELRKLVMDYNSALAASFEQAGVHHEDDEPYYEDGEMLGFLSVEQMAGGGWGLCGRTYSKNEGYHSYADTQLAFVEPVGAVALEAIHDLAQRLPVFLASYQERLSQRLREVKDSVEHTRNALKALGEIE